MSIEPRPFGCGFFMPSRDEQKKHRYFRELLRRAEDVTGLTADLGLCQPGHADPKHENG